MPVRRLVLPREVAGVNAFEVSGALTCSPAGPDDSYDPDDVVVLVVPPPARLLQAHWIDTLRRRTWRRFADWLPEALDDPAAGWRYDRLVARWADSVGADRVHVVVGSDPDAAAAALTELAGEPVGTSGWTRTLTGAEVAAVEAVCSELEELGLHGRNAADLLDGAVAAMVRTPAPTGTQPPADAVPEPAQARLAEEAGRVLAAVEAAGVALHGDPAGLQVSGAAAPAFAQVGLDAAVALSVGALERVATWRPSEEGA